MPRRAVRLQGMRERSRRRILDSALDLFARRGYASTTVRMIAENAGVAQGLLYNYYAGKEALLQAILERSMADVRESFERAAAGATPGERIERLVRAAFDIVREKLSFWRLMYQLRMQPGVLEGLGENVRASSYAIRLQLEALLRAAEGPSPEVEARVLFAAIDGAAQHYAMDAAHYPLDEVAEAIIRRFIPPQPSPESPARHRRRPDM